MKKKWIAALVVFFVLLTILFVTTRVTYPPKRPAGVDPQAEWAGGRDGGAWVNCELALSIKNTFLCTVFNDDAEHLRSEAFELREVEAHGSVAGGNLTVNYNSLDKTYSLEEVRRIGFSSYDGTKVRLINGFVLIPRRDLN